jgi:hypothetical protein
MSTGKTQMKIAGFNCWVSGSLPQLFHAMPKADQESNPKNCRPGGKKNKQKETLINDPTLNELLKMQADGKNEHGQPKSTKVNYAGYIKRGKAFLTKLVEKRGQEGDRLDGIDTDLLAKAFDDDRPRKYSVTALELYLTEKCINEGHGKRTATGIHGAFTRFWDKM